MSKNKTKLKIYKLIFFILIIILIVVIAMIIFKYGSSQVNNKQAQDMVETFSQTELKLQENVKSENEQNNEADEIQLEYKGYKVIGIIKIPKINLEYPII